MAPPLVLVPIGAFFENTLGEFSTFVAEVQFPGGVTELGALVEDWINVARDFGVTGDGSDETIKMQAALDAAATGPKNKVLIPAGMTVLVSPQFIDNCSFGYWGHMFVALFIDSGVTLRIDGVLKMAQPTADQLAMFLAGSVVIANRNSFRVTSGSGTTANYDNIIPTGFTGDTQGWVDSGAHNNSTPGTVLQLTGTPDLSGITAGTYTSFPTKLYNSGPLRVGVDLFSGRKLFEIVSVDNGAKTITVVETLPSIAAASPKAWYIENNLVDSDITIEGVGTIDCDYQGQKTTSLTSWPVGMAFRMCRCRELTIRGIKILDASQQFGEIVLSEYVKVQDVNFEITDIAQAFLGSEGDISLDCCSYVLVENCNFIIPGTTTALFTSSGSLVSGATDIGYIGVFSWATRNLVVKNCSYHNHMAGVSFSGTVGLVQLQGYGMNVLEGNGTVWMFFDERDDNRIIWNMATSVGDGTTAATDFKEVDWNCLIDGNNIRNNSGGMTLLGETFFGQPGKGIKVVNNFICNNDGFGIGLGTCDKILISNNTIKNNGWANASFYLYA